MEEAILSKYDWKWRRRKSIKTKRTLWSYSSVSISSRVDGFARLLLSSSEVPFALIRPYSCFYTLPHVYSYAWRFRCQSVTKAMPFKYYSTSLLNNIDNMHEFGWVGFYDTSFSLCLCLLCASRVAWERLTKSRKQVYKLKNPFRITTLQIWSEMKMNVENVRFLQLERPTPNHSMPFSIMPLTLTHFVYLFCISMLSAFVFCLADANIYTRYMHAFSCIWFAKLKKLSSQYATSRAHCDVCMCACGHACLCALCIGNECSPSKCFC